PTPAKRLTPAVYWTDTDLRGVPTRRSSDLSRSSWATRRRAASVMVPDRDGYTAIESASWLTVSWLVTATAIGKISSDAVGATMTDRKSTRLNSSHVSISYAVFCWKRKISSV